MNSGRNGLAIPHSFPHQLQRLIVLAHSVEELSQRERVHAQMLLVAHRVRRHLLIGDAQKRARFNVVEPTILHEEFHGGTGARAFLDFIEEDERLTGNERHLREGREVRYERIGIEIAFKQDMTLSCNDLGSLCRAAEDRRYSLRNNEETLKLKQILFFRTKAEMDAYHDMSRKPEDWTAAEIEQQRSRFCSVWQVIEEAELVDEYEAWKEANPNA